MTFRNCISHIVHGAIVLGILSVGIYVGRYFMTRTPTAERLSRPVAPMVVEAYTFTQGTHRVSMTAMGVVVPAQRVEIFPRVSGEILSQAPAFAPGGFFTAGEVIAQIETQDYVFAFVRAEAEVARAYKEHIEALGEHKVGQFYWSQIELEGGTNTPLQRQLTLREPQLLSALAAVRSAEARAEEALLDLSRTTIRAPFNLQVIEKNVDIGAYVTPSTRFATVIGTDEFWVQITLGVDQLQWLFDAQGHLVSGVTVRVRYPHDTRENAGWTTTVRGLLGDVETYGRMARVLLSVQDPLGRMTERATQPPLLLGSSVIAEIDGRAMNRVFRVPRGVIRQDNVVWVVSAEDTLEIQPVEVAWRGRDYALITAGLTEDMHVIVSAIATPVIGMPLAMEVDSDAPQAHAISGGGTTQ